MYFTEISLCGHCKNTLNQFVPQHSFTGPQFCDCGLFNLISSQDPTLPVPEPSTTLSSPNHCTLAGLTLVVSSVVAAQRRPNLTLGICEYCLIGQMM